MFKFLFNLIARVFGFKTTHKKYKRKFGWMKDRLDPRDRPLNLIRQHLKSPSTVPSSFDLSSTISMPQVYDQEDIGSCTAAAWAALYDYAQRLQGLDPFMPSMLFIYYEERVLIGTTGYDSGAMIRDGAKVLAKLGTPTEKTWPYITRKFTVKPPQKAYTEAQDHQAMVYETVPQDLEIIKQCIYSGFPIVMGFLVYESFMSDEVARTGIVPMPKPSYEQLLGGHAVVIVGYDDSVKRFKVRNSWSKNWGMKGYFTVPYDYFLSPKLADDFWALKLVEANNPTEITRRHHN